MKECSVPGCGPNKRIARGLCPKHYYRLRTTGTTDAGLYARGSLSDRLWRQIEKRGPDECWPWISKSLVAGYGTIGVGGKHGKKELAHRAVWIVTHGPIPDGGPYPHGYVVMHICDNRLCCNPAHLRLATQAENVADMHEKGRGNYEGRPKGSAHGNAKLTEVAVQEIRAAPYGSHALAARYGITYATLKDIRAGRSWRHI